MIKKKNWENKQKSQHMQKQNITLMSIADQLKGEEYSLQTEPSGLVKFSGHLT